MEGGSSALKGAEVNKTKLKPYLFLRFSYDAGLAFLKKGTNILVY